MNEEYETREFWELTEFEKAMKRCRDEVAVFGYCIIEFEINHERQ